MTLILLVVKHLFSYSQIGNYCWGVFHASLVFGSVSAFSALISIVGAGSDGPCGGEGGGSLVGIIDRLVFCVCLGDLCVC